MTHFLVDRYEQILLPFNMTNESRSLSNPTKKIMNSGMIRDINGKTKTVNLMRISPPVFEINLKN